MIVDFAGTVRRDGRRRTDELATADGLSGWVRAQAGHLDDVLDVTNYTPTTEDLWRIVALRGAVRTLLTRAVSNPPAATGRGELDVPAQRTPLSVPPDPADAAPLGADTSSEPVTARAGHITSAAGPGTIAAASPAGFGTSLRGAAVALGGGPASSDAIADADALAEVNASAALLEAPQLDWPEPGPRRRHPADPTHALLSALAVAAIDLLTGPDRERLRACNAPRCVRFFLKQNPRQEWCRPACGNRARVARFHDRRHRAAR
ncbi:ABATE domain-containing protein [Rhizomonospora bruguierae]|uniref:ABATE domain-containing protein n=1 Tax=Rhizomonospora bruguierae TaxID=1581705 RepID=UPI001BCF9D4C|nr:CGNR zinc finger domain-containing protein [Micromonospora sp. NBRC 107566]